MMSDPELPKPDETWSESAISVYQILVDLIQSQRESLCERDELLLKQAEVIRALKERLGFSSSHLGDALLSDHADDDTPTHQGDQSKSIRVQQPDREGAPHELLGPTTLTESVSPSEAYDHERSDKTLRDKSPIELPTYSKVQASLAGSEPDIRLVISYIYACAERMWSGDESLNSLPDHKLQALEFITLETFQRIGDVPPVKAEYFREVLDKFVCDRFIETVQVYLEFHQIQFNRYHYEEDGAIED